MGLNIETVADRVLEALAEIRSIPPLTDAHPELDPLAAYRVSHAVTAKRRARGETPVGRKIGFTNRTIWAEYGVFGPIWGPVYDTTAENIAAVAVGVDIAYLVEPRIEPEIMFGLKAAPENGMDEAALLGCIGWAAHGFEIVQSLFPAWVFQAADCIAAFGLHGKLLVGEHVPVDAGWLEPLKQFSIMLARNGETVDRGLAENVLDGPLSALKHLVAVLAEDPGAAPLTAGEIVTTGTVTRAFPVHAGERWTTQVQGLALPGLDVTFG